MKRYYFLPMIMALLFLSACGPKAPACPPATGISRYLTVPPETLPTPMLENVTTPVSMEIGGGTIIFNRIVEGPLCNDTWSGIVYVTCNVQVYPWEEQPTFLKDCDLSIAPGTIVYVASHNDTAYYNGCTCHTGEIAVP